MGAWTEEKITKITYAKKGQRKRIAVDTNLMLYVSGTKKQFKIRYFEKSGKEQNEPCGTFITAAEKHTAHAHMSVEDFALFCVHNKTFDDAKIFKMQNLKNLQDGCYVRPTTTTTTNIPLPVPETTFADFVDTWKTNILYAVAKNGKKKYADTTRKTIETRIRTYLHQTPFWETNIRKIQTMDIIKFVNGIEKIPTAEKVASIISTVFESAYKNGIVERNPMPKKVFSENIEAAAYTPSPQAAITTNMNLFLLMMGAIHDYAQTNLITGSALLFLALNFCRPVEMRLLRWSDIDFEAQLILLPAEITKIKKEVYIPFARQTEAILRRIKCEYPNALPEHLVFRSRKSGLVPLSDATPGAALDKIEKRYDLPRNQQTAHGFRACARTYLEQRPFSFPKHIIEKQLSHVLGDVEAAYNRAEFIVERREMLQTWADYIEQHMHMPHAAPIRRA